VQARPGPRRHPARRDADEGLRPALGPLRRPAGGWEQAPWAPVVENPWVVERDGVFHLLYSGGSWQGAYGMGHATATSPTGPFTRVAATPLMRGSDEVVSTGGGMVVTGPKGGTWLAYHGRSGTLDAPRSLRIDPIAFADDGTITVEGPTAKRRLDRP
jgi:beta-xylosidase